MGRSILFYAVAALVLVIVASNADEIEGRQSEASMGETLLVIGGVLVFVLLSRLLISRLFTRSEGRE
ncbi:hypothetical protein [Erythrobacter mangrovi]|uniref:Uncharacterized protein n=1 Tax=Erythrobacter mangrovi TaxID=2739433 RepID=A0A7D4CBX0_9SPHN|nr:hypothetical protein [Erythrobacter mangrovi]QKG70329.1 hypothetical protein HQR01_02500 [Erythrobacter mangrovi]